MTEMSNETRKRKRENEVKKWTDDDIKKVLNYMQMHRNVEKPTAKIYYKKLLDTTKVNATWNTLKCKVRHLKGTLQKAEAWRSSTDDGVVDGDGTAFFKDNILKICPHYEQLSDIFSSTEEIEVPVMDTLADSFVQSPHYTATYTHDADIEDDSFEVSYDPTTSSAATNFLHKVERRTQNTRLEWLVLMETNRNTFREKQLKLETEKFEWAKEVEKKKLEIERYRLEKEFELKKLELELKYKNK